MSSSENNNRSSSQAYRIQLQSAGITSAQLNSPKRMETIFLKEKIRSFQPEEER